jgi:hypothetical protein
MTQEQQAGFDLGSWLDQGKQALGILKEHKREIAAKRIELVEKEKEIDARIAKIESVFIGKTKAGTPDRRVGVMDLCREVVLDPNMKPTTDAEGRDIGWTEDTLTRLVLEKDPLMKDGSIRSAFRKMAKNDEIDRIGKRSSYRYRLRSRKGEVVSNVSEAVPPEDRIMSRIVSSGKSGIPLKDLAWIVGDAVAALVILDGMIHAGAIESFPIGEGITHYRTKGAGREAEAAPASNGDESQSNLFG